MDLVRGLQLKRNKDGHAVLRLHYTADPDKDPDTEKGRKWYENSSSQYIGGVNSLLWRREMEIDFKAGSGELVFANFTDLEEKILVNPFMAGDNYDIYAGMDWGRRNPIAIVVYAANRDVNGNLIMTAIWEYYDVGKTVTNVAAALKVCPYYNRIKWISADPMMWTENQQKKDGFTSIARMFYEDVPEDLKIHKLVPGRSRSDMLFIEKVEKFWMSNPVRFRIAKNCTHTIQEFRNLRYPERHENVNEPEKILDKDNHCFDSSKYCLMSHPEFREKTKLPKPNTMRFLNMVDKNARSIMIDKGVSYEYAYRIAYDVAMKNSLPEQEAA
jgi:hypothetical protein